MSRLPRYCLFLTLYLSVTYSRRDLHLRGTYKLIGHNSTQIKEKIPQVTFEYVKDDVKLRRMGFIPERHVRSIKDEFLSHQNTGRHLLATFETSFEDASFLRQLNEITRALCPFAKFCVDNESDTQTGTEQSCCKSCFCDSFCTKRKDCCFGAIEGLHGKDYFKCLTPIAEGYETKEPFMQRYNMIDTCNRDIKDDCRNKVSAYWGSFYPAFSPSNGLIYFNKQCAICNNVYDTVNWTTVTACDTMQPLQFTSFSQLLSNNICQVYFLPPENATVDQHVCYTDVIEACNITESSAEDREFIVTACHTIKAPVFDVDDTVVYANIFCKLCNGIAHEPSEKCKAPLNLITNPEKFVPKFSSLVDLRILDAWYSNNRSILDDVRYRMGVCGKYAVKHPFKTECRMILCPRGTVRTQFGCKHYETYWYDRGYMVHVELTPVSGTLPPVPAFSNLAHLRKPTRWLNSQGIQQDSLQVFATIVKRNNTVYTHKLNLKLGSLKSPLRVATALTKIAFAMFNKKTWQIRLNNDKYDYKATFDKYLHYVADGRLKRSNLLRNISEDTVQDQVYHLLYQHGMPTNPFFVNKLYFCESVQLLSHEWRDDYSGIWLTLSHGTDRFLGDNEFYIYKTGDEQWIVQICVEDFTAKPVPPSSSGLTAGGTFYAALYGCSKMMLNVDYYIGYP